MPNTGETRNRRLLVRQGSPRPLPTGQGPGSSRFGRPDQRLPGTLRKPSNRSPNSAKSRGQRARISSSTGR